MDEPQERDLDEEVTVKLTIGQTQKIMRSLKMSLSKVRRDIRRSTERDMTEQTLLNQAYYNRLQETLDSIREQTGQEDF